MCRVGMNYVFVFSSCENLDRIVIPAKKAISDIFQNFDWRHLNDRKLQMFKARNNIFVTGRNCNQFFFFCKATFMLLMNVYIYIQLIDMKRFIFQKRSDQEGSKNCKDIKQKLT